MRTRKAVLGGTTAIAVFVVVAATAYACSVTMGGADHDMQITPNAGIAGTPIVAQGHCITGVAPCTSGTYGGIPVLGPGSLPADLGQILFIDGPCNVPPGTGGDGCPAILDGMHQGSPKCTSSDTKLSVPPVGVDESQVWRVDVPGVPNDVLKFVAQGTVPSRTAGIYVICADATSSTGTSAINPAYFFNYFTYI